jgi:intein/homing endonuclease
MVNMTDNSFSLIDLYPKYVINSKGEKKPFDEANIAKILNKETGLDFHIAQKIAEEVIRKIIGLGLDEITTNYVRELVCVELTHRGMNKYRNLFARTINMENISFMLEEGFLEKYKNLQPEWGPLGYITYKRTYARIIESEDRKEEFWETVRRVVEGCYSIQKEHCVKLSLPWNEVKAQKSAQVMFEKIWNFKFLPPGRGLWMSGTEFISRHGSMALNNCGFASTADIDLKYSKAFEFVMDALMLGVGVGFDTRGAGTLEIKKPKEGRFSFEIPDSREGWVEALRLLLEAYFLGKQVPEFDFKQIRPAGRPIRGFGGVASGPGPLTQMLDDVKKILDSRIGQPLTSVDIVDIMNLIGKCVVAGNVRRCIEENQRVSTLRGLIPLNQINSFDKVLTSDGSYRHIKAIFKQGFQNLIKIVTPNGFFICTPNHRVAIYNGLKSYTWKFAKDLNYADRLISIYHLEGDPSTIDIDKAWLLGFYIGDGYADVENLKKRVGGGGTVSFTMPTKRYEGNLGKKLVGILKKLGYEPKISIQDSYTHINVYKKQLALELLKYKKAKIMPIIPESIWRGSIEIRSSFLAGLADADGGKRNVLLNSKYEKFCKQVQKLALTIGITTFYHNRPNRKIKGRLNIYDGCNYLILRSIQSQIKAKQFICPFSVVWDTEVRKVKKNGVSLPYPIIIDAKKKGEIDFNITASGLIRPSKTEQVGEISTIIEHGALTQSVIKKYRDANFDTLIEKGLVNPEWIPIKIIDVVPAGIGMTYDIEVEGNHEFVCEGFLVHNSAEIALGDPADFEFVTCKQDEEKLYSHRWASNNSIFAMKGLDYSFIAKQIAVNGEPGIFWLENARAYSRMGREPDYKDKKAAGVNPCGEQTLESFELCCLVETFPSRHASYEEFQETLKYAYLYAKSVTLVNTHWKETNAVMLKNRRMGISQTGIIEAFVKHGRRTMLEWCDKAYNYIRALDEEYSDWLCVPKSIKITTVKPSGSVSLLPGVPPGIHYPHSEYYIRRIRLSKNSDLLSHIKTAGYHIEDDLYSPNTVVAEFPVHEKYFDRSKKEVSIWEQAENAAAYQKYWSDNQVSITITFKPEEAHQIKHVLECYEDQLKSVSFLPIKEHGYKQAPYEEITKERYQEMVLNLKPLNLGLTQDRAIGERFCDSDKCEVNL